MTVKYTARYNVLTRAVFLAGAIFGVAAVATTAASATDRLVYSFTGAPSASQPEFGLTSIGDGYQYGVSKLGGNKTKGLIYRVLQRNGNKPTGFQVLYNFKGGALGAFPNGALIPDQAGNLYGVTLLGGAMADCGGQGCGVAFELVRPQNGVGAWTYKVLWRFHHAKGSSPVGQLVFDATQKNLYGATQYGGPDNYCTGDRGGCGVVFQLTRPAVDTDPWTYAVIHNFNHATGAVPSGGLTFNNGKTALYGSASGGTSLLDGVIFRLLTPLPGKTGWHYQVVYNFQGVANNDGSQPNDNLAVDGDESIYGTTQFGGTTNSGVCASGCGTAFKIAKQGTHWVKTDIHKFMGGSDGRNPMGGFTFNGSAHFVGTTRYGGGAGCGIGCGTAFSITGGGSYIHWLNFPDPGTVNDGFQPTVGPLLHVGSTFLAVMPGGGANFSGAVVSFADTPPP